MRDGSAVIAGTSGLRAGKSGGEDLQYETGHGAGRTEPRRAQLRPRLQL